MGPHVWTRATALVAAGALSIAGCGGGSDREVPLAGDGTGTIKIRRPPGPAERGRGAAGGRRGVQRVAGRGRRPSSRSSPRRDYPRTLQTTKPERPARRARVRRPADGLAVYSRKLAPLDGLVAAGRRSTTRPTRSGRRTPTSATTSSTASAMFDSGLGIYGNKTAARRGRRAHPRRARTTPGRRRSSTRCSAQLAEADPDGKPLDIKENYGGDVAELRLPPDRQLDRQRRRQDNRAEGNLNSPAVVDAARAVRLVAALRRPEHRRRAFVAGPHRAVAGSATGCTTPTPRRSATTCVVLPLPDFGAGPKSGQGSLAWGISAADRQGAGGAPSSSTS